MPQETPTSTARSTFDGSPVLPRAEDASGSRPAAGRAPACA